MTAVDERKAAAAALKLKKERADTLDPDEGDAVLLFKLIGKLRAIKMPKKSYLKRPSLVVDQSLGLYFRPKDYEPLATILWLPEGATLMRDADRKFHLEVEAQGLWLHMVLPKKDVLKLTSYRGFQLPKRAECRSTPEARIAAREVTRL